MKAIAEIPKSGNLVVPMENRSEGNEQGLSSDTQSARQNTSTFGFDFGKTDILPETEPNKDLPRDLQNRMESSFGTDFSNVAIHKNSNRATDLNALAFTQGNAVHFAPGEFNPNSNKGKNLIGHEFAHVVQQWSGVVGPTSVMGKGLPLNDNKGLEREADEMGKKGVKGEKSNFLNFSRFSNLSNLSQPIQRYTKLVGKPYDRVSDDGKLAVDDHTKDAWAESSNIVKSNKVLDALKSKAKIKELSTKLTVPVPGKPKAKPKKLKKFKMIDKATNSEVDLTDDCGDACQELLGGKSTVSESFVAANKRGKTDEFTSPAVYKGDDNAAGGIVSTTEKLSSQICIRIMKREFGLKLTRIKALKKWSKLSKKERKRLSKKYGINQYAAPMVGQGVTIGSERDMPGATSGGYNFHFGFALLSSKRDYISLEDFDSSGLKYYFKMYGPTSKKQSFAEEPDNRSALGNKTTTIVVQRPESLTGEINADKVRFKSRPSKSTAKGTLSKGTKLKIIRRGNNWMKIKILSGSHKDKSGWILNNFFTDT